MFSLFLVVDFSLLFAFNYAFCGGNLVASFEISDHDGQDGGVGHQVEGWRV